MAVRALRFLAFSLVSLAWLPLALLARVCALLGAARTALHLSAAAQRGWSRGGLAVFGVEVALEGELPAGTRLVVANHLSYLDILVLSAVFGARFVAKSEIAGWPVLGRLARLAGTIFVEQGRRRDVVRVDREMERTLAAGVPVVLFPEGHSTRGTTVDRLHSSLLASAARARIPCLAVALSYETPRDPWAPAATVCWWGGMGFARHAWALAGLRAVRVRVRPAAAVLVDDDRKRLAAALHAALLERFVPVRQEPVGPDYPWPELFEAR